MKPSNDHRQNNDLDDASRRINELLDDLGRADEGYAPHDLEARTLDAVSGVYAPGPIAIGPARTPWWRGASLRAAAALALLAGVGAVFYSMPGAPPVSTGGMTSVALAEDRIEGLLAVLDDGDGFEDQVASLELWADAIGSDAAGAWLGSDLGETGFGGGSF